MTETVGIRQDVTNFDYNSTRQFLSRFLPSTSAYGTLSYKRQILNRWTERIKASGLPGNYLVTEYRAGSILSSSFTVEKTNSIISMHYSI